MLMSVLACLFDSLSHILRYVRFSAPQGCSPQAFLFDPEARLFCPAVFLESRPVLEPEWLPPRPLMSLVSQAEPCAGDDQISDLRTLRSQNSNPYKF